MYFKRITIILMVMFFVVSFVGYAHQTSNQRKMRGRVSGIPEDDGNLSAKFDRIKHCIVRTRPTDHIRTSRPLKSSSDCTMSQTVIRNEYWPQKTYTIPVVFHIIYQSNGTGNISDQRVKDQVRVLNQDYGAITGSAGQQGYNTKIQFRLAGITRTANTQWFNDQDERGFKQALGWNQNKYLNIYVNSASGYLGYAYLPQEDAGDVYDGVVVLYQSVGGRNNGFDVYDQGRTLVHEVGHYLGLLHTFEGYGCYDGYNRGDLIADTNSENTEHYDCRQTSTCGTPDDIHNYMNYTEDSCMHEFTPEQANRMVCSLVNYRPNLYEVSDSGTQPTLKVTSPNGGESLEAGSTHRITWSSTGSVGNVKIQYSKNNGGSWTTIINSTGNDGAYSWSVPNISSNQCLVKIQEASDGNPSDASDRVFSIVQQTSPSNGKIALSRRTFNFCSVGSGRVTSSQKLWINNSGSGTINWQVSSSKSWLKYSPGSGTNSGYVNISVNASGLSSGNYTGTLTIKSSQATNSPQTVEVKLKVIHSSWDMNPFGSFSTPSDGVTVKGSVPVTGWVLDDSEVKSVKIYRQFNYGGQEIGEAVFVEGARPDVEASYPEYPRSHMAGWGYMMLTNFLPDGFYTIYVEATDNAGHRTILGYRSITINNRNAVKPFGAIDTPGQGGNASGRFYQNQGWVLTPPPNRIPTNGSTISVYVDGVFIGHPTYNIYRSDIASLFPGYANSMGAMAKLLFDTTGYSNGVHTIQWTVKDNVGNTDGVGSRYFNITNQGSQQKSMTRSSELQQPAIFKVTHRFHDRAIGISKGFDSKEKLQMVRPDVLGNINVKIHEVERLVINFQDEKKSIQSVANISTLPIGATLDVDKGILFWQPGPGFLGRYHFEFSLLDKSEKLSILNLHVNILPLN